MLFRRTHGFGSLSSSVDRFVEHPLHVEQAVIQRVRWSLPVQQKPGRLDELQAGTVTMVFDFRRWVSNVGIDRTAAMDKTALKGSPRTLTVVKHAVLTDEFNVIAGTASFPSFFIPHKPGWRSDRDTGSRSDHPRTRTDDRHAVRVRSQELRKPGIHAPASTSDFLA